MLVTLNSVLVNDTFTLRFTLALQTVAEDVSVHEHCKDIKPLTAWSTDHVEAPLLCSLLYIYRLQIWHMHINRTCMCISWTAPLLKICSLWHSVRQVQKRVRPWCHPGVWFHPLPLFAACRPLSLSPTVPVIYLALLSNKGVQSPKK